MLGSAIARSVSARQQGRVSPKSTQGDPCCNDSGHGCPFLAGVPERPTLRSPGPATFVSSGLLSVEARPPHRSNPVLGAKSAPLGTNSNKLGHICLNICNSGQSLANLVKVCKHRATFAPGCSGVGRIGRSWADEGHFRPHIGIEPVWGIVGVFFCSSPCGEAPSRTYVGACAADFAAPWILVLFG